MTTTKPAPFDLAAYNIAAEKMLAEYAKNIPPLHPDEILPVNGVINVVLSGKPFSPEFMQELYRRSRIDIPEFRIEREKMKKNR